MAQEKPKRLTEWLAIARHNMPLAKHQLKTWWEEVREEPGQAWDHYLVRYPVYAVGGLIVVWLVSVGLSWFAPPLPASAKATATTADFHVICTESSCGQHFMINRPFGFNDFPVTCPRCRKITGEVARPCYSKDCNGRWVAPVRTDEGLRCPHCAAPFPG